MKMENFEKMLASDRHQGNMEQIWDEKSAWFFHRTEKSKENFANRLVFRLIRDRALLQENSRILDIGCGTGRHLLEFSKHSSCLTGTDISSKMLTYAREKLSKVSDLHLLHGNWMELFQTEKEYDFVFASMTPAISLVEHIERMCFISKEYCMMERFVSHRDSVREEIQEMLGRVLNRLHQNEKEYSYAVWNIVWNLGYFPEILYETEEYEEEKTVEEYLEEIECSKEEEKKIREFLKSREKNGKILGSHKTRRAVILWDVRER